MAATEDWTAHFPALRQLSAELLASLSAYSTIVALPAGARVYTPGQAPQSYLLLLEGSVRVQQVSEGGREIVLYRVSAGESCVLTTACLMGYEDYLAEAVAESNVRAVAIPRATFDDMIARSPEFRRFVFTAFSSRITDLFRVIEDIAFSRMDIRLAHKLVELSRGAVTIEITQQQLAAELGSAREVVSRILAELQRRGLIAHSRGSITLLDRAALEHMSD